MDYYSPPPKKHQFDETESEYNNSELRASELHKSSDISKGTTEEPVLRYSDILTDEEALGFVKKHFSKSNIETNFSIKPFVDTLITDFLLRNSSLVSSLEDPRLFKKELRRMLKTSLTTNNNGVLSLNALEVHTKSKGLFNYVYDLAIETQNMIKANNATKLNQAILDEFNTVSKMLNQKKEELREQELRLKEYERKIIEREDSMKDLLRNEYEQLLKGFEENYKTKIAGLQKRVLANEKVTTAKVKLFESKVKDMKTVAQNTTSTEEKYKFKISSLEKTNDFLKMKSQDVEKKLALEQDKNLNLSKKLEKLQQKFTQLEKSQRDLLDKPSQSIEKSQDEHLAGSEKPLEIVDLNSSHPKPEETEEKEDEKSHPVAADKKVSQKDKVMNFDNSPTSVKKKIVPKAATSSDETKVLLTLINNLVISLKSTLPKMIPTGSHTTPKKSQRSPLKVASEEVELAGGIDIGEIFYPCFNNLIGNITELIPLLSKPHNINHIFTLMELYYKLLSFFFKFQKKSFGGERSYLSEFEIQNSMNKVKTSQDHINEIMAVATPRGITEIAFNPQSDFWKKIVKSSKPLQKGKTLLDSQPSIIKSINKENKGAVKTVEASCLTIFSEEYIQREVINLLRKFLDVTDFMLKREANQENTISFHSNFNLETQKYLQLTRIVVSLIILLLSKSKKECIHACQSILVDLNTENQKIAEFLKLYFIQNDALDVLLWHLENSTNEFPLVQILTDLFLCLNVSGNHYGAFIEQISQENIREIILEQLIQFNNNNDFCEKMCVIFQRITYHKSLKDSVSERYLRFFRDKTKDPDVAKNEFYLTNIRSILSNLEVQAQRDGS